MDVKAIDQPNLLAVEGKDEYNFFTKLLGILEITNVQILDFKGKTNFRDSIYALPNIPGFEKVRKIGFIRDADNNPAQSAFDSIVSSIRRTRLSPPDTINTFTTENPSIGVFIMPDNEGRGMLEDLCLKGIYDLPIYSCIEDYFMCVESIPDETSKASIQVYLAAKNPLKNSLGLGALSNHFDFSADHFDEIKTFLSNFS